MSLTFNTHIVSTIYFRIETIAFITSNRNSCLFPEHITNVLLCVAQMSSVLFTLSAHLMLSKRLLFLALGVSRAVVPPLAERARSTRKQPRDVLQELGAQETEHTQGCFERSEGRVIVNKSLGVTAL